MKIKYFVEILRPANLAITFLSVWGGVIIALRKFEIDDYSNVFIAAFAAALINGAGNVINDIFDVKTDKSNNKMRPIVRGELSIKEAVIFYVLLNVISLFALAFVSEELFVIALFVIVLLFLYSWKLKSLPLIGNMTVAFTTGLVFIYAGMLTPVWLRDVIPFFFAAHINLIREIVKDLEDLPGDSANNILTLPFFIEEKATKWLVLFLTIILIIATVIPYYFFNYEIEYLLIVLFAVDVPLVIFIKELFKKTPRYSLIHKLLKISMFAGLIAIIAGVV